ncbi:MAG TPA: DNA repair exonuclease [Roseiarcus sp.]
MAAFRFLHVADVHLDSPLRSLSLRDPELASLIGNATRTALMRIVDLCLEERVDALLLAGDLYDGDQTSMKTARFLADQLGRLAEANIPTFVIRGNHDALSKITRELVLPERVKVFGGRADVASVERAASEFPVVIHGLSYTHAQAPESLVAKYKAPVAGAVNIGLMHTSLGGSPGHDVYGPCSVEDLNATGFAYWALGHIHKRAVYRGAATVVMPGAPQGRDVNEAGAKTATLVTIGDDRSVRLEERLTSQAEFERVEVDVDGVSEWRDLAGAISRALEAARERARSAHLVTRLRLTGATPLAWRIRRDADLLTTEAQQRAARTGDCWVEQLDVACRPPSANASDGIGPVGELGRLMEDNVLKSDAFRADLVDLAEELSKKLPPECREAFGSDAAAFTDTLARLATEGVEDMLARLQARENGTAA